MFRPTLRTRTTYPRSEGVVEIDPARLGIEGHVNDLPGSRKAKRKGKQRQRVHDENRRRLAWRRVRACRRREGHRVGLERATLREWVKWRYLHQTQESPLLKRHRGSKIRESRPVYRTPCGAYAPSISRRLALRLSDPRRPVESKSSVARLTAPAGIPR